MIRLLALACVLLAGCQPNDSLPENIASMKVKLRQLDVDKCETELCDAKEDEKMLRECGVAPGKAVIEAKRKIGEAEHNIKVAKAKLEEAKLLQEYAKTTGKVSQCCTDR